MSCSRRHRRVGTSLFVRGSAEASIPNNQRVDSITPYVCVLGPLANAFNANNGTFTAPRDGLYAFSYYVVWQIPSLIRVDGERLMRLRRTFADGRTFEDAFIGQYQSVAASANGALAPFYTPMQTSATLPMRAGDTVSLLLYQNNAQAIALPAFVEFVIQRVGRVSRATLDAIAQCERPAASQTLDARRRPLE